MNYIGIGKNGGKVIDDDTTTTPTGATTFAAFYTLETTVIDEAPGNIEGLDGAEIPADRLIEGNFSHLKLTSGSVIAYNSHN